MRYLLLFLITILSAGCTKKESSVTSITQDSLQIISQQWKRDSLGCERLRDPKKIRQLVNQLNLIGRDSSIVLGYLGVPNGRNFLKDSSVVYYYFMACGVKERSSYNFYCNFKDGKLTSTQTMVLN